MKNLKALALLFFAAFSNGANAQPTGDCSTCKCLLQKAKAAIDSNNYELAIAKLGLLQTCNPKFADDGQDGFETVFKNLDGDKKKAEKTAEQLRLLILKYNAQYLIDRARHAYAQNPELAFRLLRAAWAIDSTNVDLLPQLWRVYYRKDLFYDQNAPANLLPIKRWNLEKPVFGLDFLPDGKAFLTRQLHQLTLQKIDGGQIWSIPFFDPIRTAQLTPDGRFLLTLTSKKEAQVWKVSDGKAVVDSLRFSNSLGIWASPDSRFLIVAVEDSVFVQPIEGDGPRLRVSVSLKSTGPNPKIPNWFAPNGDGRMLTVLGSQIFIHSLQNTERSEPVSLDSTVREVHFSFDGTKILAFDRADVLYFWHLAEGYRKGVRVKIPNIKSISFSNRNEYFLAVAGDSVLVFNTSGGVEHLFRLKKSVHQAYFGKDGQSVFVQTNADRTIRRFKIGAASNAEPVAEMRHEHQIAGFFFNETGEFLISRTDDNTCQIWNLEGRCLAKIQHDLRIYRTLSMADGSGILTASGDGSVRLWSLGEADLPRLRHESAVDFVFFSKNSTVLTTHSGEQKRNWEIGKGLFALEKASIMDVSQSPKSESKAKSYFSKSKNVFDSISVNGTAQVHFLKKKTVIDLVFDGRFSAYAFSDDDHWAALGFDNGDIRLVNADGFEALVFQHGGEVNSLAFSPDGRFLASASSDSTTRVWMLRPRDLIENLNRFSIPDFSAAEKRDFESYIIGQPNGPFLKQKPPAFGLLPNILDAQKRARQLTKASMAMNKGDLAVKSWNEKALAAWERAFEAAEKRPDEAEKFGFDPSAFELFQLLDHLGLGFSERDFLKKASRMASKMEGEKGKTARSRCELWGLLEKSRAGEMIHLDSLAALLRFFPRDTGLVEKGFKNEVRAATILHFQWAIAKKKPTRLVFDPKMNAPSVKNYLALQDDYLHALEASNAWLPRAELRKLIAEEFAERSYFLLVRSFLSSSGADTDLNAQQKQQRGAANARHLALIAARRSLEMGHPISVRRLEAHAFLFRGEAKKARAIYAELWNKYDELRPEEPIRNQIVRDWFDFQKMDAQTLGPIQKVAQNLAASGFEMPAESAEKLGIKTDKKRRRHIFE